MLNESPLILRIILIILNSISIAISLLIIVLILKLRRLYDRQCKLILFALMMEVGYSFFILLGQFYTQSLHPTQGAFTMNPEGNLCFTLGTFTILVSYCYYAIINIYGLEIIGIIQECQYEDSQSKTLFVLVLSSFFALLAIAENVIGFDSLGICSIKTDLVYSIIGGTLIMISILFLFYCCYTVSLNKDNQNFTMYSLPQKQFQQNFKDTYLRITLLYLMTFIFTRLIPLFVIMMIDQFANSKSYELSSQIITFILSIGGISLSLLRAQDPLIKKHLKSIVDIDSKQIELEVSLPQILSDSLKIQEKMSQSDDTQLETAYTSCLFNSKERITFRKTFASSQSISKIMQQINKNRIKTQFQDLKLYIIVARQALLSCPEYQMNEQINSYLLKYIRQIKCNVINNEIQFDESNNNIIITAYCEQLFRQIQLQCLLLGSFDIEKNLNYIIYDESEQKKLNSYEKFITYDDHICVQEINKDIKLFLVKYFLGLYFNQFQQKILFFLPQIFGLYSIYSEINRSFFIYNNPFNIIELKKIGFQLIGCFSYQNCQINIDLYQNLTDLDKRMQLQDKEEFMRQLNQNLSFFNELRMWGYSFNILYLENPNSQVITPRMFRTQNGYILGCFGNLFDLFFAGQLEQDTMMDPEYYSSQLLFQMAQLI